MKKPERIYFRSGDSLQDKVRYDRIGYNRACDDWEKFLPSKEEIYKILAKHCNTTFKKGDLTLSEKISKRLRLV